MKGILNFLLIGMMLLSLGFVISQDEENTSDTDVQIDSFQEPIQEDSDSAIEKDNSENISEPEQGVGVFEELESEYPEEKIVEPGLTPDSPFYFFDKFFDRFGDKIEIREEKIAEIKAMVEAGDIESAKIALEKYNEQAELIEKEIDPGKKGEARRSSAVIYKTIKEIKDEIPEDNKKEFVDDVLETENGIVTAVEIADKIKSLCEQLSELDPLQYSQVCKTEADAPEWKKKLNKKLTEEQKKEARKFSEIMSQCFKTSGRECRCEDISFYDFSVACSKVAPLAAKCDAGSEDACRMMDEIEMPELPEHLQDVFDELETKFGESKYDMYMPEECVDAGVTSPKECAKIMIRVHAPLECRQALLDANIQNEKEGREICDKIMFEKHAPQECIDKGITNPEECAKFMDNFRGPEGPGGFGPPGKNCMEIEDKMKRLECFEGAVGDVGNHYGIGEKYQNVEGEITWQCKENRIHWPPDCEKFMREEWPEMERKGMEEGEIRREEGEQWWVKEKECVASCGDRPWDFTGGICKCGEKGQYYDNERGFYDESECKDGCNQECGDQNTDCVDGKCVCLGKGYEESPENYIPPSEGTPYTPPEEAIPGPETTTQTSEPETSPEPESTPVEPEANSEPESSPVTGEVINQFLEYYSRR